MSSDMPPPKTSSEEAREIGLALKRLRVQRGLTQDQAAAGLGVTRAAWQNYEAGRAIVLRTDMQARFVKALGATRGDLMAALRDLGASGQHSSASPPETASIYAGPGRQQAVFPLAEGQVILSYPANMSAESQARLGEYLSIFLKAQP